MNARAAHPGDTPGMPRIIGVNDAAAILGVTPRTVVRWADEGALPVAFRTRGGHRRFHAETVENLLETLRTATTDDE